MAQILLHGTLHITIFEAAALINEHRVSGVAPKLFRKVIEGVEENVGMGKGTGLLYATIDLERQRVGRTKIVKKEPTNPVWNESFHIYCAHNLSNVIISIKDDKTVGAVVLGRAKISVMKILNGEMINGWFDIYNDSGKKLGNSRIHIRMDYHDVSTDLRYGRGMYGFHGVPYTYFPQRTGCRVTLYQDAHMPDGFLPKIFLKGGALRQPTRCWEDVFDAITKAQHLIYITGWSVYAEIKLVRDPARMKEECTTLGEILKKKAKEGVRVLMLVWDDRTSMAMVKMEGLMATHDEETMNYFRGTDVECVLCPRNPDSGRSMVQGFQIGAMFTHHQKAIIVDAAQPNQSREEEEEEEEDGDADGDGGGRRRRRGRRIVSFVGGLDLCDGRYDTPYHSLFRTLSTVHSEDFHQPNFTGASKKKGGPREPWHDIHSKLEGAVAWDVLNNFEQRWLKQGSDVSLLVPVKTLLDQPAAVTHDSDPQTWNVQIFRSIDGGAVANFPEDPQVAAASGLVSGKDSTIDRSIQDAYIDAIRRAKNFIYIENQYFLGSSFAWGCDEDAEAMHLIPRELALKIVDKIESGERFAVYIVVPMWPEGLPDSAQVLAILDWMRKTMEMMYKSIAQALEARQIRNVSPKDYLSFFCLGNRETRCAGEYLPSSPPDASSASYKSAQEHRRFMIYVHAKMMIVDDEYIIVGSANINQRSMDGGRDSEIAMGAYQPHHTNNNDGDGNDDGGGPKGEIHGFRMSLWYEHMGRLDNIFLKPWSLDCMRLVNRIGDETWKMYSGEEACDLPAHLLTYPLDVGMDGSVRSLRDFPCFPDTSAGIAGLKSATLPPILTT